MTKESLTIIFWNSWYYVQNGKLDHGQKLLARLDRLITEHSPDIFGLNEVVVNRHDKSSPVISFLKKNRYHCYFAEFSPIDENWAVGNLMATKQKPLHISDHILGADSQAARRGYPGHSVKAISADLKCGQIIITVVLNYMCSLYPYDWSTHYKHRKNYEGLVDKIANQNLIIGGDFNETKYMLPWLHLPKYLKRKTGSLINPTWRLNGKKAHLAFANYDNVVYREDGGLRLRSFKVLQRTPSDHSPLLAVFDIK
jgi:endonuclease/exonuclease/phosphatase family metal-dependent hydrolase